MLRSQSEDKLSRSASIEHTLRYRAATRDCRVGIMILKRVALLTCILIVAESSYADGISAAVAQNPTAVALPTNSVAPDLVSVRLSIQNAESSEVKRATGRWA